MHALILKNHNWLTVSMDGEQPLPRALTSPLIEQLTYREVKFLFGQDRKRIDPVSGETEIQRVSTLRRKLYFYDRHEFLNVPAGFLSRIWQYLDSHKVLLEFIDQTPPDDLVKWQPDWNAMYARLTPRNKQVPALEAILNNYGGVLDAAPGFGKSFLVRALAILLPRIRIAVVTKQRANVTGLVKDISQSVSVGQCGMGQESRHRVTVYSADSLHKYDGQADIMIGDEAHQLLANQYAAQIPQLFTCRRYGLTATVKGRGDNTDLRMEAIFGPTIFKMTWQEAVSEGLIVSLRVFWHSVVMDQNPCARTSNPINRARVGLWRNAVRNARIAAAANSHPDEQVLILVEKVEHAVYLGSLLPDFTLVYGSMRSEALLEYQADGLLPQDYTPLRPADLLYYRDEFAAGRLRKVIATDVWSTGVSFESLNVLIRADATASSIRDTQLPGRASRIDGIKTVGIMHDFMDQFDAAYRGRAKKRAKNYKEKGWEQRFPAGIHSARELSESDG